MTGVVGVNVPLGGVAALGTTGAPAGPEGLVANFCLACGAAVAKLSAPKATPVEQSATSSKVLGLSRPDSEDKLIFIGKRDSILKTKNRKRDKCRMLPYR